MMQPAKSELRNKLTPSNRSIRKQLFTVEDAKAMSTITPVQKKKKTEHQHSYKATVEMPNGDVVQSKTDCEIYDYKINCRSCKDMDVETHEKYTKKFNGLSAKKKTLTRGGPKNTLDLQSAKRHFELSTADESLTNSSQQRYDEPTELMAFDKGHLIRIIIQL